MIIGCLSCVVMRHQQLLQRSSPLKLLAEFFTILAGMILIWPSLVIIHMVPVSYISHGLEIDFRDDNLLV